MLERDPDGHICMSARRTCGLCGLQDIPRGIDWPWWADGRPAHFSCLAKRILQTTHDQRPEKP